MSVRRGIRLVPLKLSVTISENSQNRCEPFGVTDVIHVEEGRKRLIRVSARLVLAYGPFEV